MHQSKLIDLVLVRLHKISLDGRTLSVLKDLVSTSPCVDSRGKSYLDLHLYESMVLHSVQINLHTCEPDKDLAQGVVSSHTKNGILIQRT